MRYYAVYLSYLLLCLSLRTNYNEYTVLLNSLFKKMRPAFDDIFMELAQNLARRSHCIKAQVGSVLTKDTRIISIGYNGPPSGTHNCDEEFPGVGCPRDSKGSCSLALHAEQNAILYAVKNGANLEGTTLYVTLSPCIACARVIFTMKIKRVIYLNSYAEYKGIGIDEGVEFLRKFGVEVDRYIPKENVESQLSIDHLK